MQWYSTVWGMHLLLSVSCCLPFAFTRCLLEPFCYAMEKAEASCGHRGYLFLFFLTKEDPWAGKGSSLSFPRMGPHSCPQLLQITRDSVKILYKQVQILDQVLPPVNREDSTRFFLFLLLHCLLWLDTTRSIANQEAQFNLSNSMATQQTLCYT